jgi:SET domain-containing protein
MQLSSSESYQVLDINPQKGVGLFARRKFKVGESIYQLDYWSHEQMPMHATNHSCEPNASFNEDGMLVAVREIEPGEEITYDYVAHPIPASPWNFKCACEAKRCLGWINVGTSKEEDGVQR